MRKLWNHYERMPEIQPGRPGPELNPDPPMPELEPPITEPYEIAGKLHNALQRLKEWLFVAQPEDGGGEEKAAFCSPEQRPAYEEYDQQRRKRDIETALTQWKNAKTFFENATDPTLVDYAVFEMEAARKRYIYLLQTVRRKEEPEGMMREEL